MKPLGLINLSGSCERSIFTVYVCMWNYFLPMVLMYLINFGNHFKGRYVRLRVETRSRTIIWYEVYMAYGLRWKVELPEYFSPSSLAKFSLMVALTLLVFRSKFPYDHFISLRYSTKVDINNLHVCGPDTSSRSSFSYINITFFQLNLGSHFHFKLSLNQVSFSLAKSVFPSTKNST